MANIIRNRIIAIALGIAVAVVVAEVAVRILQSQSGASQEPEPQTGNNRGEEIPAGGGAAQTTDETNIYKPHHHLCYEIAPHAPSMPMRGPHNSLGFRGPETTLNKNGAKRIVCIGGSTTYGTRNLNEADCWPRRLESCLRVEGASVEVINAGVPAYNSAECLQLLREKVLQLNPDIIIIYISVNDIMPRFAPGFRSDYSHYRKTWLHPSEITKKPDGSLAVVDFIKNRVSGPDTAQALRSLTSHAYPETVPVERAAWNQTSSRTFQRNLESFVYASRGAGASVLLATQAVDDAKITEGFVEPRVSFFRKGLAQHANAIREVARKTGTSLLDLQSLTIPTDGFDDFVHHNVKGSAAMARLFARSLIQSGLVAAASSRLAAPK